MNSIDISVIIPVYNARLTLERCLDSVLSQSFRQFEVILIDDGSTDGSEVICDRYALNSKDIPFRVIHKENAGVSAARNTGIDMVKGRYFVCVDSDDYIEESFLEGLIETRRQFPEAGHIWCGYNSIAKNKEIKRCVISESERYTVLDRKDYMLLKDKCFTQMPWHRLFDALLVRETGLKMEESLSLGEDLLFNLVYLDTEKRTTIVFLNSTCYNYINDSAGSLNRKYRKDLLEINQYLDARVKFYLEKWEIVDKDSWQRFYNSAYYSYEHVVDSVFSEENRMSRKEKIAYVNEILKSDDFQHVLNERNCPLNKGFVFAFRIKNYGLYLLLKRIAELKNEKFRRKKHERGKAETGSVYIFCYPEYTSGGPEALHQLRYYMEQQGIDAWMVYTDSKTEKVKIPDRYLCYFPQEKKYLGELDFRDSYDKLIIMPENLSFRLFKYKKAKKVIWWLGVWGWDGIHIYPDSFPMGNWGLKLKAVFTCRLINAIRDVKSWYLYRVKDVQNYCGSKYAYEFVKSKGFTAEYLVEPISMDFLLAGGVFSCVDADKRKAEILYNPKKNSPVLQELLARKKYVYHPIQGYTPVEMIHLYRSHRIYIDFGGFPGPERIPKETAYNGCNILVGKRNAAINDFDVAIPEQYKMENPTVEEVEEKIGDMLLHYEEQFQDFCYFRNKIDGLEMEFIKSIRSLFSKYIINER